MCFLILEREKGMVGWERERENERERREKNMDGREKHRLMIGCLLYALRLGIETETQVYA